VSLTRPRRIFPLHSDAIRAAIGKADLDYCIEAGWLAPVSHVRRTVWSGGRGHRKVVEVPMYRVGDLDALKDIPGVDWEAVQATRPGRPSPLRAFAQLAPRRAAVVRAFVDELRETFGLSVWTRFANLDNLWLVDWEPGLDGTPSRDDVAALLAGNPVSSRFSDGLQLLSAQGEAIHWARRMLQPGAACVLDTETHDLWGRVMEVAVVDAASGEVLLETLVNPQTPVTEGAFAVHGISDVMVADAPTWDQVLPDVLRVTEGRKILAYNAEYDKAVTVGDCQRVGADPQHLSGRGSWGVHHAQALRLGGHAGLPAAGRRPPCPWRHVCGTGRPPLPDGGPGVGSGAREGEGRLTRLVRRGTRDARPELSGRASCVCCQDGSVVAIAPECLGVDSGRLCLRFPYGSPGGAPGAQTVGDVVDSEPQRANVGDQVPPRLEGVVDLLPGGPDVRHRHAVGVVRVAGRQRAQQDQLLKQGGGPPVGVGLAHVQLWSVSDALAKIIESKREDKPLPDAPEPEQPGKVLDLMAALTESVQQAKASRGEDADVQEMPKKNAKKTAAKKTTKKPAVRRSRSA
jgi:hypothetical protein